MKGQLSFMDYLANLPAPTSPEGTYFVSGQDAYKKSDAGWKRLQVILNVPKFGYRNLRTGYDLLQPDYIGAHWEVPTTEEQNAIEAAYLTGAMEPIDHFLPVDLSTFEWKWQRSKRREPDGTVSTAPAPGGGTILLKKVPGRKVPWIYSLDILAPDDRLFVRRELGLWCGMLYLGNVSTAEKLVQTTTTEQLLDDGERKEEGSPTQHGGTISGRLGAARDADSGRQEFQARTIRARLGDIRGDPWQSRTREGSCATPSIERSTRGARRT